MACPAVGLSGILRVADCTYNKRTVRLRTDTPSDAGTDVSQGLVLSVQVARTLLAACSSKETLYKCDKHYLHWAIPPPRSAGDEVSTLGETARLFCAGDTGNGKANRSPLPTGEIC